MSGKDIPLLTLHNALSHLLHAIKLEIPAICGCSLRYTAELYLTVEIEVPIHYRQLVVDRLLHGVLNGDYDYRFKGVRWSPTSTEPRQWISASVDLCHVPARLKSKEAA